MFKSERMQEILSMSVSQSLAVDRIKAQGLNLTDGFICHMCKIILWFDIEDSWYSTLGKTIRNLAELTLKPNSRKIPRKLFMTYLFDPHCQSKSEFERTLLIVQTEFEDEIGSNDFRYPKARSYNLDKVWKGFLGFREEILNRIEEKDPVKMIQKKKKDEIKRLCEKFFKNID